MARKGFVKATAWSLLAVIGLSGARPDAGADYFRHSSPNTTGQGCPSPSAVRLTAASGRYEPDAPARALAVALPESMDPSLALRSRKDSPPRRGGDGRGVSYFPPRAFVLEDRPSGTNDISGLLAAQFSEVLRAMDEPSLWGLSQGNKDVVAYRFLWDPGFDSSYNPTAVRVAMVGGRMTLDVVQLGRNGGGNEAGQIVLRRRITPDRGQWDRLATLVERADFWDMPTRINDMGVDGETLLVEGVRDGMYHVVERWTPRPGSYRELCRFMLDLSGLDMGQRNWPAPPPSRTSMGMFVGLLGLCLAAFVVGVVLRRVLRPRKPRPHVGLEELA